MFSIAILIGIYSYLIFSLGIMGFLYKEWILAVTFIFALIVFFVFRTKISLSKSYIPKRIPKILLIILLIQTLVNLLGALGPELGFDALWYHLTIPKIFLENHKIFHIPGGLFYYSDMPKQLEILYVAVLSIFNEIPAKIIHFSFGLLTVIAIYKLSRKFMSEKFSILSCLIFYGNLVVGWQSTTAYIDLARTFFEIMALWGFMNYLEEKKQSTRKGWFIESAVMLGLALSTKLLSLGAVFIFSIFIIYIEGLSRETIKKALLYASISLYITVPWFLFSFINTGNPIYPLFTKYVNSGFHLGVFNPILVIETFWNFFTRSSDPISPLYLIFLPIVFLFFRNLGKEMKIISIYFCLSLILWYFFPARDSRYMLPSLAAFSILISYIVNNFKENNLKNLFYFLIIFISVISIFYRGIANTKYLSFILGIETKEHFLSNHLNFSYGDFYDVDSYFKKHLSKNDKVLLYGFHNLYYADFPFIDSSYVKKGDVFNYIAVQNSKIPDRFKFWKLVYSNSKTHVDLYTSGGEKWIY